MDSAMNRFFRITELVNHLFLFLDHQGISRLMQTSHHLNTLCSPAHYHDVRVAYTDNKRKLFSSADSTQALARNVYHVRQLSLEAHEVVYYTNCVFAYQDQLLLQQTPDTGGRDLPQESHFQLHRPLWLAPPDSHTCAVFPIPPMTLLTKLEIVLDNTSSHDDCEYLLPSFKDPRATLTYICWIMDSNPHLLDVKLDGIIIKNRRDIRLLTTSIFGLKKLQRLSLYPLHHVDWALPSDLASTFFFYCPPSLQSFMFIVFVPDVEFEWSFFSAVEGYAKTPQEQLQPWEKDDTECGLLEQVPRRKEPLTHLTSLKIYDGRNNSIPEDLVRAMLAHCPNLTDVVIPELTEIRNSQGLAQDIAQLCPRLNSMKNEREDGDVAAGLILQLLGTLPQQQVVRLICTARPPFVVSDMGDLGGLFRRHSTTMRSIVLSGCQNIDSKTIQTILVECEALEKLLVDWWLGSTRHQLCIGLEDAIEYPWACTRIQELRLAVAIPNEPFHYHAENTMPYYERPAPVALSAAEKEQLSSLEALYRQIGALTELRLLDLGANFYDPQDLRSTSKNYQANTFPAMLSLGCEETSRPGFLHHFAGLTKLRQLHGSVSAETRETRATIGMEEVVWMERHWPALQDARFLSRETRYNVPKAFQWWKEQRAGKQFHITA